MLKIDQESYFLCEHMMSYTLLVLPFVLLFMLVVCMSLWPAQFLRLAEKVVTFFVEKFFVKKQPRRSKRVSFVKGLVTEAARASDRDTQVVSILRVKKGSISFEELKIMTRNDFETNNILGRRMPKSYYRSCKRGTKLNVWAHNCLAYNNCPPPKFFDSFIFRQHFRKGYAVNNSALPMVLEETELEEEEADIITQDDFPDGQCIFTVEEEQQEDGQEEIQEEEHKEDQEVSIARVEIPQAPPVLQRSKRLAEKRECTNPRRSERLKNKPRIEYPP